MGRKASKSAKKKGGGLLTGMRTGFQKSARAVTGLDGGKSRSKRQPWWSTALTLLLIAAVIVWLLYRRGIIK